MAISKTEEIVKTIKGLSALNKYRIYEILCDLKEATITDIQKELKERFGVDLAYSSIKTLLESMAHAGIIEINLLDRPYKIKLKKIIDVKIKDVE
jgi:predicted transcriptional regulator